MIRFYSTQNHDSKVSLFDAVMHGLAEDGGLFMPDSIPPLPETFFSKIESFSFSELAFEVCKNILQGAIPEADLKKIVQKAITFDAPLKQVSSDIYALELFHGPTLSFKDFGARFMAQLMEYFVREKKSHLNILVATSGDTGSAIADAFYHVEGIKVWILYPKNLVSWSQEKQLTTMGENITALEIEGTFDDCQRLVKQAFSDNNLREKVHLTSANSINIARLIPQSFYYFYAYAQLKDKSKKLVFSVPSGNFGNLTAGLLARRMGLPVHQLVAATNINDSVPKYLRSGIFQPHQSWHTLSNAMDVGNPSNFARMLDLYGHDCEKMNREIFGVSFTDKQTEDVMREVFERCGYLMDPHGAVAYLGLREYLREHEGKDKLTGIFLETAHPAKFADDVERIVGNNVEIPERLRNVLSKEKRSVVLSNDYSKLKHILLDKRD